MTEDNAEIKYTVRFEPDNIDIVVNQGDNLMEAAVAAGISMPHAAVPSANLQCHYQARPGRKRMGRQNIRDDYKKASGRPVKENQRPTLLSRFHQYRNWKAVLSREELMSSSALASGWKRPAGKKGYQLAARHAG